MKKLTVFFLITICHCTLELSAQQWNVFGGNNISSTEYLGGDGTSTTPLRLKTITGFPVNFYTYDTLRMTILGSANSGFIGIGNNFTPSYKLDVDGGDININYLYMGYRINGKYVIRYSGDTSCIYIGVGAGNSGAPPNSTFVGAYAGNSNAGAQNTFIGHSAGQSNSIGDRNTFVGDSAGFNNLGGGRNTFIGESSGFSVVNANGNTFIGGNAGHDNIAGEYNVMIGRNAGYLNPGYYNCFFGKDAGYNNTGDGNCFYGHHAGWRTGLSHSNSVFGYEAGDSIVGLGNCIMGNWAARGIISGSYNTFIGSQAQDDISMDTLNNTICLGAFSKARKNNSIILGSNTGYANQPMNVGIGLSADVVFNGPRNRLEINADYTTTSYTGNFGSGLQFRQLNSGSTNNAANYVAPHGRVLTVDANGIVKLTDDLGYFGYGACPSELTTLTNDIGMHLNANRIYYTDPSKTEIPLNMNNAIGIGYNCDDVLPGKLSVDQTFSTDPTNVSTVAGYFHNGDYSSEGPWLIIRRALYSICDGTEPWNEVGFKVNIGGDFEASNASNNFGVRGQANQYTTGQNVGGLFMANFSTGFNIGVSGTTDGKGSVNYGVYGSAPKGSCTTGSCTDAAGYFNGDVYAVNNYYTSDRILKDNIQPVTGASDIINSLNPKIFTFRTNQHPKLNLPTAAKCGLIAQEVQNILPDLVKGFRIPPTVDSLGNLDTTDTNIPYLAVDYVGIIPYLIQAAKEQQSKIDSLTFRDSLNNLRLNDLEQRINSCCNGGSGLRKSNPSISIELTNAIILNQNDPNPFAEETRISYNIPEAIKEAKIIFFDNISRILQTLIISSRGYGELNVYASNLSSGIYNYSLIADGKVIDTKKMVCNK